MGWSLRGSSGAGASWAKRLPVRPEGLAVVRHITAWPQCSQDPEIPRFADSLVLASHRGKIRFCLLYDVVPEPVPVAIVVEARCWYPCAPRAGLSRKADRRSIASSMASRTGRATAVEGAAATWIAWRRPWASANGWCLVQGAVADEPTLRVLGDLLARNPAARPGGSDPGDDVHRTRAPVE